MRFVEHCIPELSKLYTFNPEDVLIDPCARDGSLLSLLSLLSDYAVGYDIEPKHDALVKHEYVLKVDYLTLPEPIKPINGKLFVVGKPPKKLIKEFLEKSCNFADVVAFLLPKDYEWEEIVPINFLTIQSVLLEEGIFYIWHLKF